MSRTPWRVGSHYGIHVYADDVPVATFFTVTDAAVAVEAVNALTDLRDRANRAEAALAEWRSIAEMGLHLAQYGENAPGGTETWAKYEARMRAEASRG